MGLSPEDSQHVVDSVALSWPYVGLALLGGLARACRFGGALGKAVHPQDPAREGLREKRVTRRRSPRSPSKRAMHIDAGA